MKTSLVAALLTLIAGAVTACGAKTDDAQATPPSAVDPPVAGNNEPRPEPPKLTACSGPIAALQCTDTKPPPATKTEVASFVKDSAIPLRCTGSAGEHAWDLRPLVELYGSQKMFMMGEVHGTNEIGIVSALLFEQLASQGLVNVVASELPMDIEESLQNYVDDGKDPMAEQILRSFSRNFFGSILTKTARELATKGIKVRVGAVDVPASPDIAVHAIEQIATKLTTQKDTVLATLPTSTAHPPSATDMDKANAYFDHVMSKKADICAELSEADCDRLSAMTHALWASTLSYDEASHDELWFARREEVIYYNLRTKMAAPGDRMFLHMGAFHTNKHDRSAGSRMAKEYSLTKGQVFSVAPAYGDGSVIWYGGDVSLPGEPATIVSALSDTPDHPFFVSTTRPNAACEGNPVGAEPEETVVDTGTRGDLYDGYIHYGALTSERSPGETKLSVDDAVLGGGEGSGAAVAEAPAAAALAAFRARIERRERAALRTGAATRGKR